MVVLERYRDIELNYSFDDLVKEFERLENSRILMAEGKGVVIDILSANAKTVIEQSINTEAGSLCTYVHMGPTPYASIPAETEDIDKEFAAVLSYLESKSDSAGQDNLNRNVYNFPDLEGARVICGYSAEEYGSCIDVTKGAINKYHPLNLLLFPFLIGYYLMFNRKKYYATITWVVGIDAEDDEIYNDIKKLAPDFKDVSFS
ncbi:MAG: hypothetical protein U9O53_01670 [archaeon]|nr:hypothetical protein [archaeon]